MSARPPVVVPLWGSRPRGRRKIPPARQRAPTDPYGALHRKIRAHLLAQLAAIGGACPLCGEDMHAWMGRKLHLHHSGGLAAKLAGLPGDQLVHGKCNVSSGGKAGAAITNRTTVTDTTTTVRPSRVW